MRPGCETQTLTLAPTGQPTGEATVTLVCRDPVGRLAIKAAARPAQVRIDGISLPRNAALDDYPLPAGTWNVSLLSPRGRRDNQVVEVRAGETTLLVSKVR
jgi:hypothetical protein